ncbi:MAG TPA: tripartite tricarboxylate transporter substrate-binding protein [candidate division Zixibacteria bacterium]|nr:tripartite tricarboxylate transporter substrate-binding protein [candidate division Zixibacteria bacterium]
MLSKISVLLVGAVALVSLAFGPAPVFAQESFYKGKNVRFLVNFSAGGPTDVFARVIARHFPRHAPGNPAVTVQNMPGAGGIIGANYVYEVAKPDGLTVGIFSGMYLPQILGATTVRYDLNSMPIIAGAAETSVVYIRSDAGVKTAEDLVKAGKPIVVGGFTRENNKDLGLRLALGLLGAPYRYVTGYAGVAELRVAIQRGEINYTSESLTGYNTGGVAMAREGVVIPLYQEGLLGPDGDHVRDPRSDLPSFREVFRKVKGSDPSGPLADAFKISGGSRSMLRFVAVPPKTPAELVQVLRKAFRDTFEDPEFKAESERTMRFQLMTFVGEEAEKVNAAVFRAATGAARETLKKMAAKE